MSLVSGIQYSTEITGRRNAIINGDFDIWQRGTSQTTSGYDSDDRWQNWHSGSSKTASRQLFALGQTDVHGEPTFYSRTVVTSSAGVGNLVLKRQRIEGVRTFAGQTVTLSFYAKADASKNIAIEFVQHFGTGGSPSTDVTAIGAQLVGLTTSWNKYEITVTMPSISGKTMGSVNDYLEMIFWFDAGSSYAARTASLGQQSGTFDIAQVQVEKGDVATEFERRSVGEELALCQRYYYKNINPNLTGVAISTTLAARCGGQHPVTMRANPTVTTPVNLALYDGSYTTTGGVSINYSNPHNIELDITTGAAGFTLYRPVKTYGDGANRYIEVDAEL